MPKIKEKQDNRMKIFLNEQKSKLLDNSMEKWFVFGNESADLDSVISSLVYAYYKQIIIDKPQLVVPIVSIKKSNVVLKREVLAWLNKFQIDAENDLIFYEDVDKSHFEQCKITLVDHNRILDNELTGKVVEIIDHRHMSVQYPEDQLSMLIVENVGSCSSLIGRLIGECQLPQLESHKSLLMRMLYGPILLDTRNLQQKKIVEFDRKMLEYAESCANIKPIKRAKIFKKLSTIKSDLSGFTNQMILEQDLKFLRIIWHNVAIKIGVSSIKSYDVQELVSDSDFSSSVGIVCHELDLYVLIGLTKGNANFNRRGYFIYTEDTALRQQLGNYLTSCMDRVIFDLSLLNLTEQEMKGLQLPQNLLLLSQLSYCNRKQFLPVLERFFNDYPDTSCSNTNTNHQHVSVNVDEAGDSAAVDTNGNDDDYRDTLSTPKRSCNESPIEGDTILTIPSLNNRRTKQLVDRKRQQLDTWDTDKEEALEFSSKVEEYDELDEDDMGSSAPFTPDNSDFSDDGGLSLDDSDSKRDELGPLLPSLNNLSTVNKIKTKRLNLQSDDKNSDSDNNNTNDNINNEQPIASGNDNPFTPNNSVCEDRILTTEPVQHWIEQHEELTHKVNEKRRKLEDANYQVIATGLVSEIIENSINALQQEENNTETEDRSGGSSTRQRTMQNMLDEWSLNFNDREKVQLMEAIKANQLDNVARMLTEGLLRDATQQLLGQPTTNSEDKPPTGSNNNSSNHDEESGELQHAEIQCQQEDEEHIDFDLEIDYNRCPIEQVVSQTNQLQHSNQSQNPVISSCIRLSSGDLVENSSFNLQRRISEHEASSNSSATTAITSITKSSDPSDGVAACNANLLHNLTEDEHQLLQSSGTLHQLTSATDPGATPCCESSLLNQASNVQHSSIPQFKPETAETNQICPSTDFDTESSSANLHPLQNSDQLVHAHLESTAGSTTHMPEVLTSLDAEQLGNNSLADDNPTGKRRSLTVECGDIGANEDNNTKTELSTNDKSEPSESVQWDYKSCIRDCGTYLDETNDQLPTQIVAIYGCYLPYRNHAQYQEIMHELYEYLTAFLDNIPNDLYTIVYFHCYGNGKRSPTFSWFKQYYRSINYKLKKNLKHMYIIHPSFWFRGLVFVSQLFINQKFYQKIHYVSALEQLGDYLPTSSIHVPTEILQIDPGFNHSVVHNQNLHNNNYYYFED